MGHATEKTLLALRKFRIKHSSRLKFPIEIAEVSQLLLRKSF